MGQRADLVTVDLDTIRTRGTGAGPETLVFAATGADVVGRSTMSSLLLTGIAELVTNDPTHDGTPLGLVHDAAVVLEGRTVAWVGRRTDAPAADEVRDLGGRAVIPGFVDSHSHLVFAGDRAAEFSARMAGESYTGGGIRTTVAATRAAPDELLLANVARHVAEMRRQGTTTVEIKSGYGLTVRRRGAQPGRGARSSPRRSPSSGRTSSRTSTPTTSPATSTLVTGPMLDAAAPHARWIDVFCERGAFDADQARTILEAGRARGLPGRLHANQLGAGSGSAARLRARPARGRPLHLPRRRRRRGAGRDSGTVATLLPGVEFSTRSPYPDARGLLDAGVTVALATDCNPGSSYTSSMPLCVALAVREMRMTPAEALWSATAGGARGPRPRRRRRPRSRTAGPPGRAGGPVVPPPGLPPRRAPGRRRARLTSLGAGPLSTPRIAFGRIGNARTRAAQRGAGRFPSGGPDERDSRRAPGRRRDRDHRRGRQRDDR